MLQMRCCGGHLRWFVSLAISLSSFTAGPVVQSSETAPTPGDRFATEPKRPKAEKGVQFSQSWESAREEAKRTGRRIFAYFTGDSCGWCRVMEQRTFCDAEVAALSRRFVCVELNIGKEENNRVVDEYGIDTIPRTLILTDQGQVIDRRTGYTPAVEYAQWLTEAARKPLAPLGTGGPQAVAPRPVGALESVADLVIWFVDAGESQRRWGDVEWTSHILLIQSLQAAGLHPRIEHLAREDFPERWDRAKAAGKLPDLISSQLLAGLVRELDKSHTLVDLVSTRLQEASENASCPDFVGRFVHLVTGSPHEAGGRIAAAEILRPGPQTELPGLELPESKARSEAADVARRAASAFMAGDSLVLKQVASKESAQLSRCIKPGSFRRGLDVTAGPVEVRGSEHLAFAKVEITYRSDMMWGQDPFLVVLRREASQWRAMAVANDPDSLKALSQLCSLTFQPLKENRGPAAPQLSWPPDESVLADSKEPLSWKIPPEGETLAAQVCELMSDDHGAEARGESWPNIMLKVWPGMSRDGSYPTGIFVTGMPILWSVWSIGTSGRIAVSEVRTYDFADFKKQRSSH